MASVSIPLRDVGASSNNEEAERLNNDALPVSFKHLGTLTKEQLVNYLVAERYFDRYTARVRATFVDANITGSTFLRACWDVDFNIIHMALPAGPAQALANLVKMIYRREGMSSVSSRSLSFCY